MVEINQINFKAPALAVSALSGGLVTLSIVVQNIKLENLVFLCYIIIGLLILQLIIFFVAYFDLLPARGEKHYTTPCYLPLEKMVHMERTAGFLVTEDHDEKPLTMDIDVGRHLEVYLRTTWTQPFPTIGGHLTGHALRYSHIRFFWGKDDVYGTNHRIAEEGGPLELEICYTSSSMTVKISIIGEIANNSHPFIRFFVDKVSRMKQGSSATATGMPIDTILKFVDNNLNGFIKYNGKRGKDKSLHLILLRKIPVSKNAMNELRKTFPQGNLEHIGGSAPSALFE